MCNDCIFLCTKYIETGLQTQIANSETQTSIVLRLGKIGPVNSRTGHN